MQSINTDSLPDIALFDTGIVLRALGERPKDPNAPTCKALWDAMMTAGKTILIAAPSTAEIARYKDGKRGTTRKIPRGRRVVVVPFDARTSDVIAEKMPMDAVVQFKKESGLPLGYIHYDAMIVACAIRHRAKCIVALDGRFESLSRYAVIDVKKPADFEDPQGRFDLEILPPKRAGPAGGEKD